MPLRSSGSPPVTWEQVIFRHGTGTDGGSGPQAPVLSVNGATAGRPAPGTTSHADPVHSSLPGPPFPHLQSNHRVHPAGSRARKGNTAGPREALLGEGTKACSRGARVIARAELSLMSPVLAVPAECALFFIRFIVHVKHPLSEGETAPRVLTP